MEKIIQPSFSRKGYIPQMIFLIIFPLFISSCTPKIYSFNVEPLSIGQFDSVRINWKVRGKTTLLIQDRILAGSDSSVRLRDINLVVQKRGKEISQKKQVIILPNDVGNEIVFSTALSGDTLVAAGLNNPLRWGNEFVVGTITNTSSRPLNVRHEGRTANLVDGSMFNNTFIGTPVKGQWEFRSLLTPAEKANHRLAPTRLTINITVQHR